MKLFHTQAQINKLIAKAIAEEKSKNAPEKVYTATDDTERGTCLVGFNFADPNIKVFSVERVYIGRARDEHTLIGYYFAKDAKESVIPKICQWNLHCSREQHNGLVRAFASRLTDNSTSDDTNGVAKGKKLLKG